MRPYLLLSAGLAGGLWGCTSEVAPTEPGSEARSPQARAMATEVLAESGTGERITVRFRPAVDGSVRDGSIALDNSVVQTLHVPGFEDRGVIEFDVSSIADTVYRSVLRLAVFGSMGPYPFTIDVYAYAGNGLLSLADWDRGTLATSFVYSGEDVIELDVTDAVRKRISWGAKFVGFNFRYRGTSPIDMNGPFVAFHSLEYAPSGVLRVRTRSST